MKRILVLFFLIAIVLQSKAQYGSNFFRGVGIFIGPNTSQHRYLNLSAPLKDPNNPVYENYYPQNHYSAEYINFGTGILLEFLRYDHIRWQTEIEYTNKGGVEKERDVFTGTETGKVGANVFSYIQWNNYLKYFYQLLILSSFYQKSQQIFYSV